MPPSEPVRQEDFPHWVADTVRYADTDRQGHVNNAVFATLLETGRTTLMLRTGLPPLPDRHSLVLARVEIDYLGELFWPDEVLIGTRPLVPGRSSLVLEHAVLRGADCVARGRSIVVLVDGETRRPAAWPEALRAALGG